VLDQDDFSKLASRVIEKNISAEGQIEKKKMSGCSQRMRWFPCLEDCWLTLTYHLALTHTIRYLFTVFLMRRILNTITLSISLTMYSSYDEGYKATTPKPSSLLTSSVLFLTKQFLFSFYSFYVRKNIIDLLYHSKTTRIGFRLVFSCVLEICMN